MFFLVNVSELDVFKFCSSIASSFSVIVSKTSILFSANARRNCTLLSSRRRYVITSLYIMMGQPDYMNPSLVFFGGEPQQLYCRGVVIAVRSLVAQLSSLIK
jgi:hypothetical protein